MTDGLRGKEITGDQIKVRDLVRNIGTLLGTIKTHAVDYEVFPSYPPIRLLSFRQNGRRRTYRSLWQQIPALW